MPPPNVLAPTGAAPVAALSVREMGRLGRSVPRRLRFTREGKLLFFVTLGIGMGAINSGNNLLYLVLGILLSLIMVSGVLSELSLRDVTAVRHASPHLFGGEPSLVRIDLYNAKRRFTTFSVEVTELVAPRHELEQRRGFVLALRPGETQTAHLRIRSERRGVVPSAGLRITTRFPFGFFEKSRILPLATRYLVVPELRAVPLPRFPPLVLGQEEEVARLGQGDEFYGLRDGRPTEDARSIAWKVTARRDKVIVREHQRPAARRVVLVVPNAVPADVALARERLERAFSDAASLATALEAQGYAVGLSTCDGGVAPETGRESLLRIYETLALLPVRTVPPGTKLPFFSGYPKRHVERVALLTSDQRRGALGVDADRVLLAGEPGDGPSEERPARAAEAAA